ncbi:MAG: Cas10/Cmr2 second palm domain-containing protein [Halothiobacillaceae bacterium]
MPKVELEFKRIQTFLFSSPRLRAMLGANSMIGKTLRVDLADIARQCGAKADETLLRQMPSAVEEDPLVRACAKLGIDLPSDHPKSVYRSHGVLVRDGGHFIATFPDPDAAKRFASQAVDCVTENLPGILVEARLDGQRQTQRRGESLFQHPAFQVSQVSGNLPAALRGAKGRFIASEELHLEERGKRFRQELTDLIGILEQSGAIPCAADPPESINALAGAGYIALIHADGNGIGQRYQKWRATGPAGFPGEAHGESFFHSMRVAVRRALVVSLREVFSAQPERYQLLMLGGDDLLLVCSAELALPFIRAYAQALNEHRLSDGKPLHIGAGVVIAKASFPFHRLHAMAEALADSAKQRARANPDIGSVVDWHVTTNAWVNDPIAERQSESLTDGAALSGKPYPVLGPNSLQTLLEQTKIVGQSSVVARSQLRRLVETLRQGPSLAELAWHELPKEMKAALDEAGIPRLFAGEKDDCKLTTLPDLVELLEISHLGRRTQKERAR